MSPSKASPAAITCIAKNSPRGYGNTRYDFSGNGGWPRQGAKLLPDENAFGCAGLVPQQPVATNSGIHGSAKRSAMRSISKWTNKTIMYGAYVRTHSPFQNSDLMAVGPPSPEELALLEPFPRQGGRTKFFGMPFMPPVSDGSGAGTACCCARPCKLLADAGCVMKDGKRDDAARRAVPDRIFCSTNPRFQPHHMPFIKNLGTLGIEASVRLVDPVQFSGRGRDDFDFDVAIERFWLFPRSPAIRCGRTSPRRAAATKGSNNLAGISDPVIDALVEQLIAADHQGRNWYSRPRALDRIIRAGRYWVPQWYANTHRLAYWDVFRSSCQLAEIPRCGGPPDLWWSAA